MRKKANQYCRNEKEREAFLQLFNNRLNLSLHTENKKDEGELKISIVGTRKRKRERPFFNFLHKR